MNFLYYFILIFIPNFIFLLLLSLFPSMSTRSSKRRAIADPKAPDHPTVLVIKDPVAPPVAPKTPPPRTSRAKPSATLKEEEPELRKRKRAEEEDDELPPVEDLISNITSSIQMVQRDLEEEIVDPDVLEERFPCSFFPFPSSFFLLLLSFFFFSSFFLFLFLFLFFSFPSFIP